ncbi:VOC family protein [Halioxenophilus sp. WMMB6]|uniref:VOC family protein n=1 Tax=Halioxenophilus sp. WMMB6 TaxID=3073815 RepID=UPI00295EAEB3|nr:VOC family protein [Halioxenophilus sp. WMMB6]
MIKIRGLDHVVLRTTQLPQMLHFYGDLLGCPVEREMPPAMGLTQLRAGSALIDLVTVDSELGRMGGGAPQQQGRNVDHFCLQVEPIAIDALRDYLTQAGVACLEDGERYGSDGFGLSLYVLDPEGNTVELRPPAG